MSQCISPDSNPRRGQTWWTVLLVAPAMFGVACASSPEPEITAEDLVAVQERVEDIERTNGRLTVRIEETERQVSLMQDRVESNRIALQRHGYLRGQGDRFARIPSQSQQQRPQPAPESNYPGRQAQQQQQQGQSQQGYQADPTMRQRMDDRGYRRIPLSDQQSGQRDTSAGHQPQTQHHADAGSAIEDPAGGQLDYDAGGGSTDESDTGNTRSVVITNETLEQRYGSAGQSSQQQQSSSSSTGDSDTSSGDSGPTHVPVTSERLPTSDELDYDPGEQQSGDDTASSDGVDGQLADASDEELLDLYQDSLAEYRNGDYAQALEGFTRFLDAGATENYVDNALYWIGECHYGLGEYETSVDYFTRILDELPNANKVPDAMLKMSLAYEQLGEVDEAVDLLEELTERYPNTNPGRLGQEQLEEYAENGDT